MAKGPGPGVRKPRFKQQLWHSLAGDYGQVTPEDPVSLSRKMQKENGEEEKKKKMVKKLWVVPSIPLLPFFLRTFCRRLRCYSPQSPLQVGQPVDKSRSLSGASR